MQMIRRAGLLVCERAKRNLAGDEGSLRSSSCIMHGVWAIYKMFCLTLLSTGRILETLGGKHSLWFFLELQW